MKEVKAIARNVRSTARKARIPANAVRGMNALFALDALKYMPKKAAHDVRKVVASAIANAVNNDNMKEEILVISQIFVDDAFTMKRFRPESKGRVRQILKRNCHITVYVSEGGESTKKTEKSEAVKKEVKKTVKKAEEKAPVKAEAKKKTETKKSKSPSPKK